jgi:nuclear RNA export factor
VKEDDVFITVNQEDASMILKLNTFKFAGTALTIKALEESPSIHQGNVKEEANMSQEAKDIQERIRQILSIRYDVNLKLLNLSALGKDPGLVEMGMFDAQNRISKLFPVLMVVCDRLFTSVQQKQEAIVSVTLADNELDSISSVTSLAQTFPDIRNLDLSRNKFSDLRGLEGWRWRFRKLQNLKIIENPIENIVPDYKQDLAKWFPTLQILNEIQIRTPEEVAAATQAQVQAREQAKLSPIPIAGPDFRDVNQIGEGFVRQFLPLYDNDRISLLNRFYDQYSEHSISVNTSAPRSEQQPSAALSWAAYIKRSRNLFKVSSLNARISRLYRGSENIKRLWLELPPTRHPDLATQAHKYVVDCHSTPGLSDPTGQNLRGVDGLILMIHGEFEEPQEISPVAVLRGFSRTFVLGPGLSDISPIRVISDLLVLRAWSPLALNLADGVQAAGPNSEEKFKQQEIMNQLVHRTQMTPEYASMCLIETGWDLEKAFTAFEANRVQ